MWYAGKHKYLKGSKLKAFLLHHFSKVFVFGSKFFGETEEKVELEENDFEYLFILKYVNHHNINFPNIIFSGTNKYYSNGDYNVLIFPEPKNSYYNRIVVYKKKGNIFEIDYRTDSQNILRNKPQAQVIFNKYF